MEDEIKTDQPSTAVPRISGTLVPPVQEPVTMQDDDVVATVMSEFSTYTRPFCRECVWKMWSRVLELNERRKPIPMPEDRRAADALARFIDNNEMSVREVIVCMNNFTNDEPIFDTSSKLCLLRDLLDLIPDYLHD